MADPVTRATPGGGKGGKKLKTSTIVMIAGIALVGGYLLLSRKSGSSSDSGTQGTVYRNARTGPGYGELWRLLRDWQGHHHPRPPHHHHIIEGDSNHE